MGGGKPEVESDHRWRRRLVVVVVDANSATPGNHSWFGLKNCFLHRVLAGGELGQDVVWILVVVGCRRDGLVDGDLRVNGLVPLLLLGDHGELVAKHLTREDLERGCNEPGKYWLQLHFKS